VKITEIIESDEGNNYSKKGMFVKAIPYRDRSLNKFEKEINI
jgi:hypothetical protein